MWVNVFVSVAVLLAFLSGSGRGGELRTASWHRSMAKHQRELDRGRVDICFVGDSLTEFWIHTGKAIWALEFHRDKCVNLGIAGDRTEDVLFRVRRTDFSVAQPQVFVVMVGTNNLGKSPPDYPESVAVKVVEVVLSLRAQCPDSEILLLSILPSLDTEHAD